MGLFKALKNTVLLPVDIVRDVVTLGGTMTDDEVATGKRLETIGDEIKKWADED